MVKNPMLLTSEYSNIFFQEVNGERETKEFPHAKRIDLRIHITALGTLDRLVTLQEKLLRNLQEIAISYLCPSNVAQAALKVQLIPSSSHEVQQRLIAEIDQLFSEIQSPQLIACRQTLSELAHAVQETQKHSHSHYPLICNGIGSLMVSDEHVKKFLPLNEDGGVVRSLETGSRPVNFYHGVFWKVKPSAPGFEVTFHLLGRILCGLSSAPSELGKIKTPQRDFYLQASLGAPGMGMHRFLLEHPDLITKIDPIQFGHTVFLHLLGKPQDAKPDNFMVELVKNNDGDVTNVRWQGIDEDQCFVDPICRHSDGTHFLNLRSIFFCLPQIFMPIHRDVQRHWALLNIPLTLMTWLKELSCVNKEYLQFQRLGNVPEKKMKKLHLPILLPEGLIREMYHHLALIQTTLQQASGQLTYMDLIKRVMPAIGHLYEITIKKFPRLPYQAFLELFVGGGPALETVLHSLLPLKIYGNQTLQAYLESCKDGGIDFELKRTLTPEQAMEQLLQIARLDTLNPSETTSFIEILTEISLNHMTIRNHNLLSDENIERIIRAQPHLQKLTLINCPMLTDQTLERIAYFASHLELKINHCSGMTVTGLKRHERQMSQLFVAQPSLGIPFLHSMDVKFNGNEQALVDFERVLDQMVWDEILSQVATFKENGLIDLILIKITEKMIVTDLMERMVATADPKHLKALFDLGLPFLQKNSEGKTFIHLAAENGAEQVLSQLLTDVNDWRDIVDHNGQTPLFAAVHKHQLGCLKQLLAKKAPVNVADKQQRTPLFAAIENRHEAAASLLTEAGTDLSKHNNKGLTAAHYCCLHQQHQTLAQILKKQPTLANQKDYSDKSPMHLCVEVNDVKSAKILIPYLQWDQLVDKKKMTLLHHAAQLGRKRICELILKANKALGSVDHEGMTPLHHAVLSGVKKCLPLFKPTQADLAQQRADGKHALHLAVLSGNYPCFQWVIDHKAPLSTADLRQLTPAHYAAAKGEQQMLDTLIQQGFAIETADANGETCLHKALRSHHFGLVAHLITQGASLSITTPRGFYPLHLAAKEGDVLVISLLIDKYSLSPNLTAQNLRRETPLHLAAGAGQLQAVEALLNHGANPNQSNKDGKMPLHLAMQQGFEEVAKAMIRRGANCTAVMNDGWTTLHYAVNFSHPELIDYILAMHPGLLNQKTHVDGHTPLHKAMYQQRLENLTDAQWEKTQKRQVEVLLILFRHGADVNCLDSFNYSPLHLAAKMGRRDFASLLLARGAHLNQKNDSNRTPKAHAQYMVEKSADPQLVNDIHAVISLLEEQGKKTETRKIKLLSRSKTLSLLTETHRQLIPQEAKNRLEHVCQTLREHRHFLPETLLQCRLIEEDLTLLTESDKQLVFSSLNPVHEEIKLASPPVIPDSAFFMGLSDTIRRFAQPLSQDELIHLIRVIALTLDVKEFFIQLNEHLQQNRKKMTADEAKNICLFITLLPTYKGYLTSDFPPDLCQTLSKRLAKIASLDPIAKCQLPAIKEFLDRPSVHFAVLSATPRNRSFLTHQPQALAFLDRLLKCTNLNEQLEQIDQLTLSLMRQHVMWFQGVAPQHFRFARERADNPLKTLLDVNHFLRGNSLIFLFQAENKKEWQRRLQLLILWMGKSRLLGDLHQCYALYSALTHPSVLRAQRQLKKLPTTIANVFRDCSDLFMPEANFINYTQYCHTLLTPFVPALAIEAENALDYRQNALSQSLYTLIEKVCHQSSTSHFFNLPQLTSADAMNLFLSQELYPEALGQKDKSNLSTPGEAYAQERSLQFFPPQKSFRK